MSLRDWRYSAGLSQRQLALRARSATELCSLIRLCAAGVYSCSNASSSETLRLRLYAGTTLLLDSGAQVLAPGASPASRGWRLDAALICAAAGASGSLECQGRFDYHPTAASLSAFDLSSAATVGLNTTLDQALSLSVQWNNALSSSSITLRQFTVERFAPPY